MVSQQNMIYRWWVLHIYISLLEAVYIAYPFIARFAQAKDPNQLILPMPLCTRYSPQRSKYGLIHQANQSPRLCLLHLPGRPIKHGFLQKFLSLVRCSFAGNIHFFGFASLPRLITGDYFLKWWIPVLWNFTKDFTEFRTPLLHSLGPPVTRSQAERHRASPHWLRTSRARSAAAAAGALGAGAVRAGHAGNSPGGAASRRRDIPAAGKAHWKENGGTPIAGVVYSEYQTKIWMI